MKKRKSSILAVFFALLSLIGVSILLGQGCGSRIDNGEQQQQGATTDAQMMAQNLPGAPAKALFGQYFKDKNKRVWIYDGAHWVPHDSSVDTYYEQFITPITTRLSMTQGEVKTAPCGTADGTGAHPKHAGFGCKVCHMVGGVLCFDPAGPATSPSPTIPPPSFDATAKTCSNIACHAVAPGTFSYYYPGDEVDADGYPIPVLKTVHYGGGAAPQVTPSWYTTPGTAGCTTCHANPPAYGSDGSNAWHSSVHANNQNVGAINPNACELCHNDPTKPYGTWVPIALSSDTSPPLSASVVDGKYHGYQINTAAAAQHANGTASVNAKFVSQCFGCH